MSFNELVLIIVTCTHHTQEIGLRPKCYKLHELSLKKTTKKKHFKIMIFTMFYRNWFVYLRFNF